MVDKYTSPKSSAIRQLNDELEQGILRSVENNPLVALGLDRVGVEQMSTLFDRPLEAAKFNPAGFSKERLEKLGYVGGSPVDFDEPSVVLSIGNMAKRGPALTRSDLAHEYGHAGIAALANFKPHNIGRGAEEAIMRHQDIQMGGPKAAAESQKYVDKKYVDPEGAMRRSKDYHKQLSDKAAKRLYNEGKRMTYKTKASEIASRGRGPDTTLVHMAPEEVMSLGIMSGAPLPINPDTGFPEAGGLLPILGSLAGAFLTGGQSLWLQAGASGLGSLAGSMAQGDSLKEGLMTGLMSAGTTGLLGGMSKLGGGLAGETAMAGADTAGSLSGMSGIEPYAPIPGFGTPSTSNMFAATPQGPFPYDTIRAEEFTGLSPSDNLARLSANTARPLNVHGVSTDVFTPPVPTQATGDIGYWEGIKKAAADRGGGFTGYAKTLGESAMANPEMAAMAGAGLLGGGTKPFFEGPEYIPPERKKRATPVLAKARTRSRVPVPYGYDAGQQEARHYVYGNNGGLVRGYRRGGPIGGPDPDQTWGEKAEDFAENVTTTLPGAIDATNTGIGLWGGGPPGVGPALSVASEIANPGQTSYATGAGILGGVANAATNFGLPGLGLGLTAIGTGFDVYGADADVEKSTGINPDISYWGALASNLTPGALGIGQSVDAQRNRALAEFTTTPDDVLGGEEEESSNLTNERRRGRALTMEDLRGMQARADITAAETAAAKAAAALAARTQAREIETLYTQDKQARVDAEAGQTGGGFGGDGGYGTGPSESMDPGESEPGGMSGDDWATGGLIGGRKFANGGGPVQAQPQQNPIVQGAIAAIIGQHPQPRQAIQSFVQVYGPQAFAVLRERVIAANSADQRAESGIASTVQGPGDGLSDGVPANIDGQEEVRLSDGEVVVPADVVSGLGNGSSEAGAKQIEQMNNAVRQQRTGTPDQPDQIDAQQLLAMA